MFAKFRLLLLTSMSWAFDCNNSNLEIGLASQGFTINEETLEAARSACYQVLKLKLEQAPRYIDNEIMEAPFGALAEDDGVLDDVVLAQQDENPSESEAESISAPAAASDDDSIYDIMPEPMSMPTIDATTTHTLPVPIENRSRADLDSQIENAFDAEGDAEADADGEANANIMGSSDEMVPNEERTSSIPMAKEGEASDINSVEPKSGPEQIVTPGNHTPNSGSSALELVSMEDREEITLENTAPAPPKSRFEELLELYPELLQYTWPAKNIYKMNVYRPTRIRTESLEGQKRMIPPKLQKNLIKHNIVERTVLTE